MASYISNPSLKQLLLDNKNVQFVKNDEVSVMRICFFLPTPGLNYKVEISRIEYNSQVVEDLSQNGIKIVILHEFMHAYLAQIGLSGTDAEDHQKFLDRGEYLQAIKDLFPNEDDDFYEVVKYAGCVDCEAFTSLSRNEQTYINNQLNNYLY